MRNVGHHDRDLLASRAIVYGTVAVVILGVYVAVLVGIGRVLGDGEPNRGLALVATGVVAAVFQPLRRRLQRLADRTVYGRKATPHEVLSEFSRRVAADDDALLAQAAESLVAGTAADRASVSMKIERQLVEIAAWPTGTEPTGEDVGAVTSVPIVQDGVELGALNLSVSNGQRLSEQDLQLTSRLASGMGLALGNRIRTDIVHSRVDELRRSRRRLVAVLDDTRRHLERDLHDGAQQQLVGLKVKLALAQSMCASDGAVETTTILRELTDTADVIVEAMREFGRGLYPPLLEAEGLGPAITAQARQASIPVTLAVDGLGRYDQQIETAINLCVVGALDNVARHARANAAQVSITQRDGWVEFSVTDDGVGFDPTGIASGAGLSHMADRVDAVAGTLCVQAAPGQGTTVSGAIPLGDEGVS